MSEEATSYPSKKQFSVIDGIWFERGKPDHLAYLLTMILHELRALRAPKEQKPDT